MPEDQEDQVAQETSFVQADHPDSHPAAQAISTINSSPPGIRDMLSSVVNVSASGVYHEPSCVFCRSQHRNEAEQMVSSFDLGVRDPDVRISQFFNTIGEEVSVDIVRNHIASHMNKGDIELRKLEYIARVANMANGQMTTLSQAKLAAAAVIECIASSGSIIPTKGLSPAKAQEIKASVISKLVKSLIDVMAVQAKLSGQMWDEGKMVAIPADDFSKVFDRALNDAQTPDERRLIGNLLDGLTKAIQK